MKAKGRTMKTETNAEIWMEENEVGIWVRSDIWTIAGRTWATIDGERAEVVRVGQTWVVA